MKTFVDRVAVLSVMLCGVLVLAAAPAKKAPAPKAAPPPPAAAPTSPMPKVRDSLGEKVLGSIGSATTVQAWRVNSTGGLRPDPTRAIGSDFVREAAGKVLSEAELTALRGLLYDEKSYRFEADVSRCDFKPDVGFHIENGLETLEVLVSFSCSQVLFYAGKPGGRWLPAGTFDVKPARPALLALSRSVLPADAVTQKLK